MFLLLFGITSFSFVYKLVNFPELHASIFAIVIDPTFLLLIASLFGFVISFFGCVGALRENLFMLRWVSACKKIIVCKFELASYTVMQYQRIVACFILLGLIFTVLVSFVLQSKISGSSSMWTIPTAFLQKQFELYDLSDNHRDFVDKLQQSYKCCGFSHSLQGYAWWNQSVYFGCNTSATNPLRCAVPQTCCIQLVNPIDGENVNFEISNEQIST